MDKIARWVSLDIVDCNPIARKNKQHQAPHNVFPCGQIFENLGYGQVLSAEHDFEAGDIKVVTQTMIMGVLRW